MNVAGRPSASVGVAGTRVVVVVEVVVVAGSVVEDGSATIEVVTATAVVAGGEVDVVVGVTSASPPQAARSRPAASTNRFISLPPFAASVAALDDSGTAEVRDAATDWVGSMHDRLSRGN